ncbi:MAG: chromophore lyase CpcT/CpeT [Planctomycetota bacterium]
MGAIRMGCPAACGAYVVATVAGCTSAEKRAAAARDAEAERLATYLTGAFSSEAQAASEPAGEYFDIRMFSVRIWEDREDGPWLYVEQAQAGRLATPYRQRVYQIDIGTDSVLRSAIHTLPGNAMSYAGWWRTPERFDALTPEDIAILDGCTVYLTAQGEAFVGGTVGNDCANDFRDAAYMTSEMTLFPDALVTWDRGWDVADEQAWGPTGGGYVFARVAMPE